MPFETLAFGVEPCSVPYRLKLARYPALAEAVLEFVSREPPRRGRRLKLLDVGTGSGIARRFIEAVLETDEIDYHGVDLFPHGHEFVYKHEDWNLHEACLEKGLPFLDSNCFDIVICEQVLEHLHNAEAAAAELLRVLRPGGMLIAGVPIFPHGTHLIRRHLVPVLDRLVRTKKKRGHVQAFSLRTFLEMLDRAGPMEASAVRGFRIMSGGPLRPLECFRWWWKLNCLIGRKIPGLCVETQVVAIKTEPSVLKMDDFRQDEQPLRRAA